LSEPILDETARVLLSKSRLRAFAEYADTDVRDYVRWLLTRVEIVPNVPEIRVVAADPKDDPIIATAVAAAADYLVTGERAHLLPIGEYRGVQIVSPRAFLTILGEP
jgi:predicted nucleic acid-binding protein